jgi:hypothetical protein
MFWEYSNIMNNRVFRDVALCLVINSYRRFTLSKRRWIFTKLRGVNIPGDLNILQHCLQNFKSRKITLCLYDTQTVHHEGDQIEFDING